jgi:class 3 adenylate cyclase/tetratricopeptide (TPR) repeat protein
MSATALVTLLFTDVVASTELNAQLGHSAAESLRRAHFAGLRDAIAAHHGREVKTTGDGLMVSFARTADGLDCAIAMQEAAEHLGRSYSRDFHIRIGISVGEATNDAGDWFGQPVVEAARLCSSAAADVIRVAHIATQLLDEPERYAFSPPRDVAVKGMTDPVSVVEVGWTPRTGRPFPTRLTDARTTAFVGRDRERAAMEGAWRIAATGERRALLVAGEPGIGKTSLVAEVASALHMHGAAVLYGHCDEGNDVPYQPFAEIVDDAVRAHVVPALTDDVELAPLRALRPRASAPDELTPINGSHNTEFDRFALFHAVECIVHAVARSGPVVVVIDDLHWASTPTLLLLHHALRRPDIPVLWLLTYRDTDLRRAHPLAATLADLRRVEGVERISLDGLHESEVEIIVTQLLAARGVERDAAPLADALHRETEGNPFFVHEVLRHLVETKQLEPAPDGAVEDLGIPESVREVIGRRLDLLSDAANRALTVAAVIGRAFELDVIERVTDDTSGFTLDALEEAGAAHLIVESPDAPGRYSFVHSLVQQALYDEMTAPQRAHLHHSVGLTIEVAGRAEERALALARHFAAAGGIASSRAARYALLAAEQLCERAAFEEALTYLEQALDVLDLAGEHGSTPLRIDLHLAIAHAARLSLDLTRAHDAALAAADMARTCDLPVALGRAAVAYAAGAAALQGVEAVVIALCDEALARIGNDEPALRSELLASLAAHRAIGGEGTAAEGLALEAVALARRTANPETLWSALLARYVTLYGSADAPEQLAVAEELTALPLPPSRRRSGWMTLNVGPSPRSIPRLVLGDRAGFDADVNEVARLVASYPHPLTMVLLTQWRGLQSLLNGDLDAAARHAEQVGKLAVGQVNWDLAQAAQILWLAFERGELPAITPLIASMADANPTVDAYSAVLAMAEAYSGDVEAAVARAMALVAGRGLRRDYTFGASLYCLTEVAAVAGATELAGALHEQLEPYAGLMCVVGTGTLCTSSFDRLRAMSAMVTGDFEESDRGFAAALALEEAFEAPPLATRTRYWYAQLLARRGGIADSERAAELLRNAAVTSERHGLVGLQQLITPALAAGG